MKTKEIYFKAIGFFILLIGSFVISNCAAAAQSVQTWRNGVVAFKSDAGIVAMAHHKGFDRKHGVNIKNVQFKGDSTMLKALVSGSIDSYDGEPGVPLTAVAHGAKIKTLGCFWPVLTYSLYSKKGIKSPADLKGKKIAVSSPGSLPAIAVQLILSKYGVSDSDVHYAMVGSDADRVKALAENVVDAAAAGDGFIFFVRKHGDKELANIHHVAPMFPRFCTYVTEKTLRTKHKELVRYLAAKMEGLRYALGHRKQVLALTKQLTGMTNTKGASYVFNKVKKLHAVDWRMPMSMKRLVWMDHMLVKIGKLNKPVKLSRFTDPTPRKEALALLAKSK